MLLVNLEMNQSIEKTVEILKKGGIILYPTDTIWGIGCDATNHKAVQKIYEIKKREEKKAMVILLDSANKINNFVKKVPDLALDLIESAKKPTTIIYENAYNLPSSLIGTDNSIAVRITNEPFSKKICEMLGKPIVSTSANISGEKFPENYSQISEQIISKVDYVVRYRRDDNSVNTPSQIIKLENNNIKIIRK